MYFKNKTTGVTWHITDTDHQKRLREDTGYLVVTGTNTNDELQSLPSESVHEPVYQNVDFKSLKWNELRKLASENGINVKGLKRDQIEMELAELGDINDN